MRQIRRIRLKKTLVLLMLVMFLGGCNQKVAPVPNEYYGTEEQGTNPDSLYRENKKSVKEYPETKSAGAYVKKDCWLADEFMQWLRNENRNSQ